MWMRVEDLRPEPGAPWVGLGKSGRRVPRLVVDVGIRRLSGMEEAPALLDEPVFQQVGVPVAHVVTRASDAVEEQQEIGFVLFAGG
jgi:hypothetical protein